MTVPHGRTKVLHDALPKLLRRGRSEGARKLVDAARAEDLAVLFRSLTPGQRASAFRLVDDLHKRAELVSELDPSIAEGLLGDIGDDAVIELLHAMSNDDAADVLQLLPEPRRDEILTSLSADDTTVELAELYHYEPETAAGIMSPDVFALDDDTTVSEAIRRLQQYGDDFELSYYLYVTGAGDSLVGVVSLRQLVLSSPDTPLRDIMEPDVVRVEMSTDQEEVASVVARYNLLAVPVVDPSNRLIGIVTVDDIIDVIRHEATEDMLKMVGAGEQIDEQMSTVRAARARLPWLLASFLGGIAAALLIGAFEASIAKVVPLAAFIPIVLGMSGNIGIQSATIITRGIALGRIETTRLLSVVGRELIVAIICGIAYGMLLGLVAWVQYYGSDQVTSSLMLGGTVGLAVACGMVIAATTGAGIPIVFARLNVDPALAAGPFVTTTVDVLGIAVYFLIAIALLGI